MSWRYSAWLGASDRLTYRPGQRAGAVRRQRMYRGCFLPRSPPVRQLLVQVVASTRQQREWFIACDKLLSVTTRGLCKSRRASFPPARLGSPARSFPAQTGAVRAAQWGYSPSTDNVSSRVPAAFNLPLGAVARELLCQWTSLPGDVDSALCLCLVQSPTTVVHVGVSGVGIRSVGDWHVMSYDTPVTRCCTRAVCIGLVERCVSNLVMPDEFIVHWPGTRAAA